MFEAIFLILVCIYFLITVFLITGIKKTYPKIKEEDLPSVSIIVAARNEEKNIGESLISLDELIYPDNKIEIILVNDNSDDLTSEIIDKFIAGKAKFKKINITREIVQLKGKTRALAEGIKYAEGEIILLTDADCKPSEAWAYNIASYYKPGVGMVNGFTTQIINNSFSGMQALDFIYLLSVASGMINNGYPVSCIGNNMSFRKKAYIDAGGYENLPFSVTEDFALLNVIYKLKKYKIIHPIDANTLIISKPCISWKELFHQKKRWAVGGKQVPLRGLLIIANAFLVNLFILLTPLFFNGVSLYLAVFKISIDLFFIMLVHKSLGISKNLKYFAVFELYYILYTIVLPFVAVFSRKVKWKGREYL